MVRFSASVVASPAFGDVDADGDQDCVVVDEAGTLNYFRNVGTATHPRFEHVTGDDNPFAALSRSGGIYDLSFQDWNKDGLLDLFINTTYYKNTGTKQRARFAAGSSEQEDAPVMQSSAAGRYSYTPLRFVDLDGDGTAEVMQGTARGGFIYQTLSNSRKAAVVSSTAYQVSPNPAKGAFTIRFPAAAASRTSTIKIMDVGGKVLSSQATTGSSTVKVGAALQTGVYILQISQNNTVVFQQKIIKE